MIINMASGGGGGATLTTANVQLNYAAQGVAITATSGGTSKTVSTDSTGLASFTNLGGGTWSFTSAGGATVSQTITLITTGVALNISKATVSTTNTASTITASRSGYSSVTAPVSSGTAVFYDLAAGEWTFSDGTDSSTGTVVAGSEISINIGITPTTFHSAKMDATEGSIIQINVYSEQTSSSALFSLNVLCHSNTTQCPTTFSDTVIQLTPGQDYYFGGGMGTAEWNAWYDVQPTTVKQSENCIGGTYTYTSSRGKYTCPNTPPTDIWYCVKPD